jgi:ABC-type dipeptide/oligopeptide/nickel transport system permease component
LCLEEGFLTQVSEFKYGTRRSAIWNLCRGIAVLLISGLAGATLVRLAPGFGLDERSLDARFSADSLKVIKREYSTERGPLAFYVRFLSSILRGEAGRSVVFAQPVGSLIRERAPQTLRTQALKRAPVDVTLIDKRNFHLFQPLLYRL